MLPIVQYQQVQSVQQSAPQSVPPSELQPVRLLVAQSELDLPEMEKVRLQYTLVVSRLQHTLVVYRLQYTLVVSRLQHTLVVYRLQYTLVVCARYGFRERKSLTTTYDMS
jgi:hypothetical protein